MFLVRTLLRKCGSLFLTLNKKVVMGQWGVYLKGQKSQWGEYLEGQKSQGGQGQSERGYKIYPESTYEIQEASPGSFMMPMGFWSFKPVGYKVDQENKRHHNIELPSLRLTNWKIGDYSDITSWWMIVLYVGVLETENCPSGIGINACIPAPNSLSFLFSIKCLVLCLWLGMGHSNWQALYKWELWVFLRICY